MKHIVNRLSEKDKAELFIMEDSGDVLRVKSVNNGHNNWCDVIMLFNSVLSQSFLISNDMLLFEARSYVFAILYIHFMDTRST